MNHVKKLTEVDGIYGFVGGTHLVDRSDEYVEKTISELRTFGLKLISPCHCTDFKAETRLCEAFSGQFMLNYSGRVIEAGKMPEPRII